MTVVDNQHAAQAVTDKGKVFVFDAIECMVNYLQNTGTDAGFAHLVVCDYENPGVWVQADAATFLISESLPSPMGANLSAFAKESHCTRLQESKNPGKPIPGVSSDTNFRITNHDQAFCIYHPDFWRHRHKCRNDSGRSGTSTPGNQ